MWSLPWLQNPVKNCICRKKKSSQSKKKAARQNKEEITNQPDKASTSDNIYIEHNVTIRRLEKKVKAEKLETDQVIFNSKWKVAKETITRSKYSNMYKQASELATEGS